MVLSEARCRHEAMKKLKQTCARYTALVGHRSFAGDVGVDDLAAPDAIASHALQLPQDILLF